MTTRYGEMMDMISCFAIDENGAKPKPKKRKFTYDEAMALK